ncbi:hypothetical protein D8O27_13515 [Burkholderia mallei]|uniref:Uncharacterized protein n=3 Tax=Burkholderia mallei TaxID=13373 RepID=A2S9M3_BURM9|nr:hypothetical protein BMA2054 [Burkholderia mallei ATCC 23344]ABM50678.1 conserved hypothetical protein [Burkholderia mallei SAVP1]ABN02011.1 conserved hypothetical protein [Burkholderia mallei NCTC 10229]EDK53651.1 conserved hypothetical protein [Burkholderia mallei FMH]EDK58621.1 conserved hypothetical protein [Burkholderia mallei JHU]EDK83587.1 conserved hypothetical protein [Burkholderia mallei 2002721280]EEP88793.1 conserved hypothetical protein [Burkholderia mallei GB8 horse 4]RKN978
MNRAGRGARVRRDERANAFARAPREAAGAGARREAAVQPASNETARPCPPPSAGLASAAQSRIANRTRIERGPNRIEPNRPESNQSPAVAPPAPAPKRHGRLQPRGRKRPIR